MIRAGRLALCLGIAFTGPTGAAADVVDGNYGDAFRSPPWRGRCPAGQRGVSPAT